MCSGIDDVGEAFTRLEAANWNLVEAVNAILEVGQNRAASLNFAGSDPVVRVIKGCGVCCRGKHSYCV